MLSYFISTVTSLLIRFSKFCRPYLPQEINNIRRKFVPTFSGLTTVISMERLPTFVDSSHPPHVLITQNRLLYKSSFISTRIERQPTSEQTAFFA